MAGQTPIAHKRAISFALSRIIMLATTDEGKMIFQQSLFASFRAKEREQPEDVKEKAPERVDTAFVSYNVTASDAIHIISVIIANADPTPTLIELLLQPIAPHLYLLLEYLCASKTADPTLRESVESLLATWGRLSEAEKVVSGLWEVVEDISFEWTVNEEGDIVLASRYVRCPHSSILYKQLMAN